MQNPVHQFLTEREMSINDLATIAGVQRAAVSHLLQGYAPKLSGKVLQAMVELGCNREQVVNEYGKWRQERANELKKQFA